MGAGAGADRGRVTKVRERAVNATHDRSGIRLVPRHDQSNRCTTCRHHEQAAGYRVVSSGSIPVSEHNAVETGHSHRVGGSRNDHPTSQRSRRHGGVHQQGSGLRAIPQRLWGVPAADPVRSERQHLDIQDRHPGSGSPPFLRQRCPRGHRSGLPLEHRWVRVATR